MSVQGHIQKFPTVPAPLSFPQGSPPTVQLVHSPHILQYYLSFTANKFVFSRGNIFIKTPNNDALYCTDKMHLCVCLCSGLLALVLI